jgi:hypothetical protein
MSNFTVVGVSTQHGITKVRFANDIVSRTKLLAKGGHSPLELIELPEAMSKADACAHLLKVGGVFAQWSDLITETMGKKVGTPKVAKAPKAVKATPAPKAKVTPVKAEKPAAKAVKINKAKVVEDLEVTEIKELAEAPM